MTLSIDIARRQGDFTLNAAFVSQGGLTALFGRSGSGKTTIVNAIAGLVRPDRGRIVIGGVTVFDAQARIWIPPHRRRLGYVFQEARLFPHMSVRQNLLYAQRFGGRATPGASLAEVVAMLDIAPLLERYPAGLSGGEQQRVAIGRALLSHPSLLLMDEPLASLDDARKQEILPYIERLRDAGGVPIVYVSHSISEVRRLARSVALLENGKVSAYGAPADVLPAADDAGPPAVFLAAQALSPAGPGLISVRTAAGDVLAAGDVASGRALAVRIAADALILTDAPQTPTSAAGVLTGEIMEIEADGPWAWVRIRLGGEDARLRATVAYVDKARLRVGDRAHVLVARAQAL